MRVHVCAVGRIRADQPERALFEDYHMRFNRTGKPLALGPMIEIEVEDKSENAGEAGHLQSNVDIGSGGGEPYRGLDGDIYYKKNGRAYRQENNERVGFLSSKVRGAL